MLLFYIVQVVFGIGILIFVHELGHFLLAKKCGVRVETFAVGFGPRIFGWRRNKEGKMVFSMGAIGPREAGTEDHTDYRVSLVPLGGYVKMAGEEPDEPLTGAEWEFPSKTVGQRAAIIVAGVIFNAIFAFLVFILAFQVGVQFTYNDIGFVNPGQSAWQAGLDSGDKILEISGAKIEDFDDLATIVAFSNPQKGETFKFQRGNKIITTRVYPEYNPALGFQTIGIGVKTSLIIQNILRLENQVAPAELAGLKPEDEILALEGFQIRSALQIYQLLQSDPSHQFHFYDRKNKKDLWLNLGGIEQGQFKGLKVENLDFKGLKLNSWEEFQQIIAHNGHQEIPLRIRRDGKDLVVKVIPHLLKRWMLGIENGSPLRVEALRRGSLASEFLQIEDLITQINGQKVSTYSQLIRALGQSKGDVKCTLKRDDKILEVSLVAEKIRVNWLLQGVHWGEKLKMDWVRKSSLAGYFFQPGDQILELNGKKVDSLSELTKNLLKIEDSVYFLVKRGKNIFVTSSLSLGKLRTYWIQEGVNFENRPLIGKVLPHFPAQKGGLREGDEIVAINDINIASWGEMAALIQSSDGKALEVKVLRKGKEYTFNIHPQRSGVQVENVDPKSPFGGFQKGDLILAVGNTLIDSDWAFRQALGAAKEKTVKVTLLREDKKITLQLDGKKAASARGNLSLLLLASRSDAKIGVRPKVARHLRRVPNLVASIILGCKKSYVMVKRILLTLKSVLTAKVSAKNLGGPVLIAQASYSLAKLGFGTLLYFLGLLSLNLAVINILPIPILDGGHLMFLGVEKIKGSKVREETMMIANYMGLAILIFLMVFVTYNDIMRIFR